MNEVCSTCTVTLKRRLSHLHISFILDEKHVSELIAIQWNLLIFASRRAEWKKSTHTHTAWPNGKNIIHVPENLTSIFLHKSNCSPYQEFPVCWKIIMWYHRENKELLKHHWMRATNCNYILNLCIFPYMVFFFYWCKTPNPELTTSQRWWIMCSSLHLTDEQRNNSQWHGPSPLAWHSSEDLE